MAAKDTGMGAVNITFSDITFTVVKGDKKIQILKGISGNCGSGRVLAIMGASGAGKTTLLDTLSGHTFGGGKIGGTVLVNGVAVGQSQLKRMGNYVQQRDVLMASSTVRETLVLSAMLKLPRDLSTADKLARVDATLKELDLEQCADTLVGDEGLQMKGISGGQKRRVSVGVELVKDSRLLFLDEPTSGLDSEMAVSLMDTLTGLARKGRTVVLTIHQPNSLITSKFDDLMLLGDGRLLYHGPWKDAVDFFAGAGYPCPAFQNPTDYFMAVARDPEAVDTLATSFEKWLASSPEDVEAGNKRLELSASKLELESSRLDSTPAETPAAPPASFWYQAYVLAGRMFRQWLRNPAMLTAELMQYVGEALFVGLMYLQLSHSASTGVPDRLAALWFSAAMLSFTPSYTAVTQWDSERQLLRRETSGGMYTIRSWFAAKTATVTPIQIVQTAIFCAIAYWMVGLAPGAAQFFVLLAVFVMFQLTSETIGVLCATLTKNSTFGVLALTFVMLFLLSFSGFLVSSVPVYFRWVSKINPLTYAYTAMIKSQFDATTFYDAAGMPVAGSALIPASVDNGLSVAENMLVQLGMMVGTRLLAYASIEAGALLKFI